MLPNKMAHEIQGQTGPPQRHSADLKAARNAAEITVARTWYDIKKKREEECHRSIPSLL
jgi:hypothetical protein